MSLSKYQNWERKIINILIHKMQVDNGDAQNIVEVNSFTMAQGWNMGSNPNTVAQNIIK